MSVRYLIFLSLTAWLGATYAANAQGPKLLTTLESSDMFQKAVVFSPDGGRLVATGDHGTCIWEVTSGKKLKDLVWYLNSASDKKLTEMPTSSAFMVIRPDGRLVACGKDDDPTIFLIELESGRVTVTGRENDK